MTNKIFFFLLTLLFVNEVSAQQPTHRARFKYRIRQSKLDSLEKFGVFLKDDSGKVVKLCSTINVLKCLITNKEGELVVDPWAITDVSITGDKDDVDKCLGDTTRINSQTPYPLRMNIKRGKIVGNPTKAICFHYQTWLFGVNTLGVKFRPSVTDYKDSIYNATVLSGTINLGLTVGYSYGWTTFTHRSTTNWSITPAFALGISSVDLTKEPLKKKIDLPNRVKSNFILSPALSAIIARNDLGIVISYGTDIMMGKNSSSWVYQGKPFWGIGLSAQFKL